MDVDLEISLDCLIAYYEYFDDRATTPTTSDFGNEILDERFCAY